MQVAIYIVGPARLVVCVFLWLRLAVAAGMGRVESELGGGFAK